MLAACCPTPQHVLARLANAAATFLRRGFLITGDETNLADGATTGQVPTDIDARTNVTARITATVSSTRFTALTGLAEGPAVPQVSAVTAFVSIFDDASMVAAVRILVADVTLRTTNSG